MEKQLVKQPTYTDWAVSERRNWVFTEYLNGRYRHELEEDYISKFNLTVHSFDVDVKWVYDQLRKRGERELDAIIDKHTDYYYHIYKLAIEKMDYRSAKDVLRNIEDLYKLHKPTSTGNVHLTQKTTNNYDFSKLTFDELKQLYEIGRRSDDIPVLATDQKTLDISSEESSG